MQVDPNQMTPSSLLIGSMAACQHDPGLIGLFSFIRVRTLDTSTYYLQGLEPPRAGENT